VDSTAGRSNARRRILEASFVALLGSFIVAGVGTNAAMANSPTPTAATAGPGTVLQNANGTVTVNFSGTWIWPFSSLDKDTMGINATVNNPCDHRFGAGWGVVWSDPNDPGFIETYNSHGLAVTVGVGSRGKDSANADTRVTYDAFAPCGTFQETNNPAPGDGNIVGTFQATHTYANAAALPSMVCVITYDLGFGKTPVPSRVQFTNDDNSVAWSLFLEHGWNQVAGGPNCTKLPAPVPAPPTPTTPAPPVTKTVSNVVPPPVHPATPKAVKTVTPGILAFTGFGPMGQLLALLGVILLLVGVVLYFVDVRKVWLWLLGL